MLETEPSGGFVAAFVALVAVMATGFVAALYKARLAEDGDGAAARRWGIWGAAAVTLWLGITGGLAGAGLLHFGPVPPPIMIVFVCMLTLIFTVSFSRVGTVLSQQLPLWFLVGFQAFRIPVELLLHRAYSEGLMPVEMSYEGWNFDVVSGVTGLLVGGALLAVGNKVPQRLLWAWNVLGFALLLTIITIANLATPFFGVIKGDPPNVWITHLPFVWLPTVHVVLAFIGHLLVFRRLSHERAKSRTILPAHAEAT